MTRDQLERRVDVLAAEHRGQAFAEAVRKLSESLAPDGQDELKEILLRRAAEGRMDVLREVEERRWWRRLILFEPRRR